MRWGRCGRWMEIKHFGEGRRKRGGQGIPYIHGDRVAGILNGYSGARRGTFSCPTIHSERVGMSKAASSSIADPAAGLHTYLTHVWPRRRERRPGRDDSDSRCMFIMKDFDIYVDLTAPSPPAGAGRASRCSFCSGPTSQGLKTRFTPAEGRLAERPPGVHRRGREAEGVATS